MKTIWTYNRTTNVLLRYDVEFAFLKDTLSEKAEKTLLDTLNKGADCLEPTNSRQIYRGERVISRY